MSYWKGPGSVTPAMAGLAIGAVFIVSALALGPGGSTGTAPAPAEMDQTADAPASEEAGPQEAGADAAAAAVPSIEEATQITKARIVAADSEPQNWLSHGRTYSEQRYSPLTQVNADNVDELGLAWSYEMYTTRGLEASPIVVDGYMFVTGNWGVTHAIDARTGEELWMFDPEVPGEWGRYGCCDVVNRGVAVWEGKVYVASFDGRLHALDAKTGTPIWQVDTVNNTPPYTITGAPRVINGKVIIGNGGAELGVRGYVTAYDVKTGAQKWRAYATGPDDGLSPPSPEKTTLTICCESLVKAGNLCQDEPVRGRTADRGTCQCGHASAPFTTDRPARTCR